MKSLIFEHSKLIMISVGGNNRICFFDHEIKKWIDHLGNTDDTERDFEKLIKITSKYDDWIRVK